MIAANPSPEGTGSCMLIDDFRRYDLTSALGTRWRSVTDRVMGGVSDATVKRTVFGGRPCLHLAGDVRLENNGGFVQAALDLSPEDTLEATGYSGIRLVVRGNNEIYAVHLRTPDNLRSWQSYRASFTATAAWQSIALPFQQFLPHRLETPLDISRLRRIGLVAIGRAFRANLMVAELSLYR